MILDSVGGNLEYFTDKDGRSCRKSTYITLMPPLLDILDESGLALGALKSASTFLGTAIKQVRVRVSCGDHKTITTRTQKFQINFLYLVSMDFLPSKNLD